MRLGTYQSFSNYSGRVKAKNFLVLKKIGR